MSEEINIVLSEEESASVFTIAGSKYFNINTGSGCIFNNSGSTNTGVQINQGERSGNFTSSISVLKNIINQPETDSGSQTRGNSNINISI